MEQCRRIWGIQSPDSIWTIPRLKDSIVSNIVCAYQYSHYFHETVQEKIDIFLKQIPNLDMEKAPTGTGLLNGYAGEGMIRLTALKEVNIAWVNLL